MSSTDISNLSRRLQPMPDIKPYVRDIDDQAEVRCGWLDEIRRMETTADDRFER